MNAIVSGWTARGMGLSDLLIAVKRNYILACLHTAEHGALETCASRGLYNVIGGVNLVGQVG